MRTQTLEVKRKSVRLTPKQRDEVVDAVANLIVTHLKKTGGERLTGPAKQCQEARETKRDT